MTDKPPTLSDANREILVSLFGAEWGHLIDGANVTLPVEAISLAMDRARKQGAHPSPATGEFENPYYQNGICYHIAPVVVDNFRVQWAESDHPQIIVLDAGAKDGSPLRSPQTISAEHDKLTDPDDEVKAGMYVEMYQCAETLGKLVFLLAERCNLYETQLTDSRREALEYSEQHAYWYRRNEFGQAVIEAMLGLQEDVIRQLALAEAAAHLVKPGDLDEETREEVWDGLKAGQTARRIADSVKAAFADMETFRGQTPADTNYEDFIRDRRQAKVLKWAITTFGAMEGLEVTSLEERAFRHLEESLELVQACIDKQARDLPIEAGIEGTGDYLEYMHDHGTAKAHKLVARVFKREVGEIPKEIGQVMVTLNSLAECLGVSIAREERKEFARVLSIRPAEFQERHRAKQDEGL